MNSIKMLLLYLIFGFISLNAGDNTNWITVNVDSGSTKINKNIYGHFAEHLGNCIYGGFWVGEDSEIPNTRGIRNDVIEALKEIDPPVIRWPGGCFADYYHWKDGIGPREQRPSIINSSWGGVTEDNSFGTHEFLDLCDLLDAEPYLCVNVGSGTVQEAADWVEYVNSSNESPMTKLRKQNGREEPWNVKFWAVGNESWGCGGNMSPDYYSDLFKRFATYMRAGELFKIASGGIDSDYNWTETVMKKTQHYRHLIQGYSFHYYSVYPGWTKKSSATEFSENEWFHMIKTTLAMEERLVKQIDLMDEFDPDNKIGLMADEWGTWYEVEPGTNPGFLYQQNTLRDAVIASLFLNIFNNNAKRVQMANIAQTINVLQAMLLTKGKELVKTPSFYLFRMYKVHQDATLLPINVECESYEYNGMKLPAVSASASKNKDGNIHISLTNINPDKESVVSLDLHGKKEFEQVSGEIITADAMNAYNDFGMEEKVNINSFTGFELDKNNLEIVLPPKSVVTLEIKN